MRKYANFYKYTSSSLLAMILIIAISACSAELPLKETPLEVMTPVQEESVEEQSIEASGEEELREEEQTVEESTDALESTAAPAPSPPEISNDTTALPALHLEGTQLTDSEGNSVQLKGVSTHGLAWYPQYVNQEFFTELHEDWNANVVRLAMYTAEYGGYCNGGDKEALKSLVKDGVRYATEAGLYVIIDWHVLSDANPHNHKEDAKAFFEEMSAEFADHDNVLYELCNEPNGVSWTDVKSYAEELIPIIRANDENAIIIVGTPNWCQEVDKAAADPITDYDNILYSLHFYAASHTDWLRDRMKTANDAGLPMMVTEFGTCDYSGNGAIDYAQCDAWIQAMDECGISYVAWNLSNKNETSAVFKPECTKTSGFTVDDLSENGKWIYGMLQK